MARSHNRKAHYTHTHIDYIPHKKKAIVEKKKTKSILTVTMTICTIFFVGIAWFAARSSVPVLIIVGVIGLVVGYYGGKQLDKSFEKN